MATAFALASDILGSAVTSYVYAKNKKIDLRHGWLMLTCIVVMCMAGSVAAYFTHQSVLGNFALFLCVAIGIRFLVKPDSKDKPDRGGTVKLTAKEIAVSLFFGLTIVFGTGFFGSGGGMMMPIVFTAMLGYDRRTAVGTSTFIMTFTALIASVSHILMEPAILLECWDYLLLSIGVATFFSLVSARFANRVNAKVVGLVTGATLLLGLAMIFPNNIDRIDMAAVAVKALFLAIIIIGLASVERLPLYRSLFVEKGRHEVLTSFIMLFTLMAVLIAVFWGALGEKGRYIPIATIMAWGTGDGAAAICGRLWGKHKLQGRFIEGVKSVEGTVAMALTSFCCTLPVLLIMSGLPGMACVLLMLLIAPAAALTALLTKHGLDTITVPIASSLLLSLTLLM